jgi:hypothetical protein
MDSSPYHIKDDDDEEDEDNVPDQLLDSPEYYDDDLDGNGSWGNVMGEPARL